jgi:hypothetical protein
MVLLLLTVDYRGVVCVSTTSNLSTIFQTFAIKSKFFDKPDVDTEWGPVSMFLKRLIFRKPVLEPNSAVETSRLAAPNCNRPEWE